MVKRIDLYHKAPVFVTVNVETGAVERVYLDDESVVFHEEGPHFCVDGVQHVEVKDPALLARARAIAESVDWTSTENRCEVWRGAVGGPPNTNDVILQALGFFERDVARRVLDEDAPAVELSDVVAVKQFVIDAIAWDAEQQRTTA